MQNVDMSSQFGDVSTPEEEEAFAAIEKQQMAGSVSTGASPSPRVSGETYEEALLRFRVAHPDHTRKTFPTRMI